MAHEFKVKNGLLIEGSTNSQPVIAVRNASTEITQDASSLLVTAKAIHDYVDSQLNPLNTSLGYYHSWNLSQDASIQRIDASINNTIDAYSIFILNTSLGTDFYWENGYIEVSVGGGTASDASLTQLYNWQLSQDASINILRAKDASQDASIAYLSGWNLSQDASITFLRNWGISQDASITGLRSWEISQDASIDFIKANFIRSSSTGNTIYWNNGVFNASLGLKNLSDVSIVGDPSLYDVLTMGVSGKWEFQEKEWYVDSSLIQPVNSDYDVQLNSIQIEEDAGSVSIMDMPVSSTPASGTEESYTFNLDGNPMLTIYGEATGAGGVQNKMIDSVVAFKAESSLYFTGISESEKTKILYYDPASGQVYYGDPSTSWGGESLWDVSTDTTTVYLKDPSDNLQLSYIEMQENGGAMTFVDLPCSSTAGEQSYSMKIDGSAALKIYGSGSGAALSETAVVMEATYFALGDPNTNGSWRLKIDISGNLSVQKRESGSWIEKGNFN